MTVQTMRDDLALPTNTPTQVKFLLHHLEQAVRGIGLYVNSNKTEFMSFKHNGAISKFNSKPLKLGDLFRFVSSHISIESNVNICI